MKQRHNYLLALFLAAILMFTGCSQSTPSKDETASPDGQLQEFQVVLDWYPNAIHAFLYEAIDKGYFADEGLDVQIQFPANTNDAISLTAAGKADVGIYYLHDVAMARANQQIPVKSIGAVTQGPLNVFVSLGEKNITTPADLAGKTIGTPGTETSNAMVHYVAQQAGLSEEDYTLMDVGFDLMSAMTTGNVDATIGCMVNHEVPQLRQEGFTVNVFSPTDYGVPNYYEMVFVTGEDQIDTEPEALQGFLRACQKGFEEVKAHPEEYIDLLLTYQNEENFPLDKAVEMESIETLLPIMETEQAAFLSQDPQVWEENIQWLQDVGVIQETFPAQEALWDSGIDANETH